MRAIKFRVWDNEENNFWGEGRPLNLVSLVDDSLVNDDDTVLEQYTGLNDKNGTAIFEGDIVRQQMRFAETNGVIFWQEEKSRFAINLDGFITTITKPQESSYEVVGNIHENPELLEVSD